MFWNHGRMELTRVILLATFSFQMVICLNFDQSKFVEDDTVKNKTCPEYAKIIEVATINKRQCILLCSRIPNEKCKAAQFVEETTMCYGCTTPVMTKEVNLTVSSFKRDISSVLKYLVSGPNGIPDDHLSASDSLVSTYSHGPERARLYTKDNSSGAGAGGWEAKDSDPNKYIQADFGRTRYIVGIATQGRHYVKYLEWVTAYKFSMSLDCDSYGMYKQKNNTVMVLTMALYKKGDNYYVPYHFKRVFPGNSDSNTVVTNMLPTPVYARCVRLHPVTWNAHATMRFDILGV